jgi:hypothetical protein
MFDEERLKEKLRAIEALIAGATTEGEREAADRARLRISDRLRERVTEQEVEWRFSLDRWTYRLLVALARRHGLEPYRYRGQRHLTLQVKAPLRFLKEKFLPAFDQMASMLEQHLTEVTAHIVAQVLEADESEPAVVETGARQLSSGLDEPKE